jgi:biopolymer transport protein ExbD
MAAVGTRRGAIVGINVTPMVDIMLVLLVIMMVTATYIVAQSFNIELPKTATSDDPSPSPTVVTLSKDDKTYFNDQVVTEAELATHLGVVGHSPDANVVISADRAVKHGSVMHVIDVAKLAGVTKFALNVERD